MVRENLPKHWTADWSSPQQGDNAEKSVPAPLQLMQTEVYQFQISSSRSSYKCFHFSVRKQEEKDPTAAQTLPFPHLLFRGQQRSGFGKTAFISIPGASVWQGPDETSLVYFMLCPTTFPLCSDTLFVREHLDNVDVWLACQFYCWKNPQMLNLDGSGSETTHNISTPGIVTGERENIRGRRGGIKGNHRHHLRFKWLLFFALRTIGPTSVAVTERAWHWHATDVTPPLSGQNPPIKPKLVAKRALTPPSSVSSLWVRRILHRLHPSLRFGRKQRQSETFLCPEITAFSRHCRRLWRRLGNDLICTSVSKVDVTARGRGRESPCFQTHGCHCRWSIFTDTLQY